MHHGTEPTIIRCASGRPAPGDLERAAAVIRRGGVLVYPTETVYGIGCDALDPRAVERVFGLKKRDGAKPLPVIVPNAVGAARMAADIPPAARRLMDAFWPGPLTIVLPAAPEVPSVLHAGTGTVGMRVSSGPAAAALCRAAGTPLVATSANRSGEPAALSVDDLPADVVRGVDTVIDGGPCLSAVVSTVVDLSSRIPRILRRGAVADADVMRAVEGA